MGKRFKLTTHVWLMDSNKRIILIVLDSLREDYSNEINSVLKKYGFFKFPNVISPAPWTLPSHASMFTGMYPILHGAHESKKNKIPHIKLKIPRLLTHELSSIGFKNHLFSANDYIQPFFGFRGFHHIKLVPAVPIFQVGSEDKEKLEQYKGKNLAETLKNLLTEKEFSLIAKYSIREISKKIRFLLKIHYALTHNWPLNKGIENFRKFIANMDFSEGTFLFVNLMEMHEPYGVFDTGTWYTLLQQSVDKKLIELWKKRYPVHAKYLAKKLDLIMAYLEEQRILEKSLVIITSDHGQLIGERGKISHGLFLWDELLKVPLWMNINAEKQNGYVSLTHIKNIVMNYVKRDNIQMDKIYKDYAFAESYGFPFAFEVSSEKEKYLNDLDAYRIALYCEGGKAVFNIRKWEIEEIYDVEEKKAMNLILRFLKYKSL